MEYIIAILILLIPLVGWYYYRKGKRKGASEFFQLIAAFGYDSKVKTFRFLNQSATLKGTVFVGDSITQDFNVYEAFKGHLVYNRGIGGDTTEGVLRRLNVSVYELKPARVFILIGTNDLALLETTTQAIVDRIWTIIDHIYTFDPTIEIFLLSILPVNETMDKMTVSPRTNQKIDAINEKLNAVDHATWIDLSSIFKDENGRLKPELSMEGLHLSPLGYHVLSETLKPFIK